MCFGFICLRCIRYRFVRYRFVRNRFRFVKYRSPVNILLFSKAFWYSRHVPKSSSRHIFKISWRNVLKTSWRRFQRNNFSSSKASSKPFQDNFITSCKMSSRRLRHVLENEKLLRWRRVKDVFIACLEDVFKTSLNLVDQRIFADNIRCHSKKMSHQERLDSVWKYDNV